MQFTVIAAADYNGFITEARELILYNPGDIESFERAASTVDRIRFQKRIKNHLIKKAKLGDFRKKQKLLLS